ncbi:VWA domain-containing protein [Chloroflexia bacterium SDU3-3]|nr:VWA domain-containing protein [Chloroflexia bacterium SDU3-3]
MHMQFLLPIGLLALLALPVIVLLHIIRERRRRQVVPSLLHWRDLPRPQGGQRLSQLPISPLLLLQLLAALLLALALARPQLLAAPLGQATQLVLVIDTSTSMAARDGSSTRFDQAVGRARALLGTLPPGGSATLIAAGSVPQVVAQGDRAAAEAALGQLRPGGTVQDMGPALALADAAVDAQHTARIVVLTDGGGPRPDAYVAAAPIDWQQIGGAAANRAIIAFAARAAGGKTQVYARVANYGDSSFDGMLRLFSGDEALDARPVQIAANAEAEQTWTLPAGGDALRLELDGGDALPDDDTAVLSLAPERPIRVLLVAEDAEPLQRALKAVPGAQVSYVPPSQYAAQQDVDVTVFDTFLPNEWPAGAALAIYPPTSALLPGIAAQPVDISGETLETGGSLLGGLGLGGVNFGLVRGVEPYSGTATLLRAGETPLIQRGQVDGRSLAIWSFDIHQGNIATRLAFPLLVSRTLRDLAPTAPPASLVAGATMVLRPDPRTTTVELVAPNGQVQRMPGGASVTLGPLAQAGWYDLIERGPSGERYRGKIAVNAGAAAESSLRQQPAPTLSAAAAAQGGLLRRTTDLWPGLALLAAAILIFEWLYIHRPLAAR